MTQKESFNKILVKLENIKKELKSTNMASEPRILRELNNKVKQLEHENAPLIATIDIFEIKNRKNILLVNFHKETVNEIS